jgi:2-polyprenyl-3-methyl-5-hydroxy-6-metoxy-1,4-benzoquinol methylase
LTELLSDPIRFWDQRHGDLDAWRSGGDRGLSAEENYEFYAFRLGRIIELVRRHSGSDRGQHVLDAGCGRGHMTEWLSKCGHAVTGVDSSQSAVDWAITTYGPKFEVASLDGFRPRSLFDVVLCLDVLFHILDDDVWRASLGNLTRAAHAESTLIVTDALRPERFVLGNYIVHRALGEYDELLASRGFKRVELQPYAFGSNPNQFAVYRRAV